MCEFQRIRAWRSRGFETLPPRFTLKFGHFRLTVAKVNLQASIA